MLAAVVLLALVASPSPAVSPSTIPAIAPVLDDVKLGEPLSNLRERYGDPVATQELPKQSQRIWRFLENGNRFLDVLESNGVAISVTVAKYTKTAEFTDQYGIAFGASAGDVSKALGQPQRVSRNADDGSIDLWYRTNDAVLIYEFLGDRLVFEQLLAPRAKQGQYPPAAAVDPHGGTSTADAVVVSPPQDAWIHAYLALNGCDNDGHWEIVSTHSIQKGSTYQVVHTACSSGNLTRDFFFELPAAGTSA